MKNYEILDGKFVIHNYLKSSKFSSFLPSISGMDGKPLYVFYTNRGQAVASFGINSKENIMTPFLSAFKTYEEASLIYFRTFIYVDDKLYQPFTKNKVDMIIERSKLTIIESNNNFDIKITYTTLSHSAFPALIRKVEIKNKCHKKCHYDIIDGLPIFLPRNTSCYLYNSMTTLLSAYCQNEIVNNVGMTRSLNGEDSAIVSLKEDVNGFVSIDKNNHKLTSIIDKDIVFSDDNSLINPLKIRKIKEKINSQQWSNKISSAFSYGSIDLSENEDYSFISIFSSATNKTDLLNFINQLKYEYLDDQFNVTSSLVDSLLLNFSSNNLAVDNYIKQCYLDNGLRGGFIEEIDNKFYYLYSRKHGDLERDYNAFLIPSTYFSSGTGNYRDINQNRRNDLYICPKLKDFNIYLFFSLIEANGYNPLFVDVSYPINESDTYIEALNKITNIDPLEIKAKYNEGYWIDHFSYNTDLLENYLSIYPDKTFELLFDKKYRYFDSNVKINPRNIRYKKLDNGEIRQYNSLDTSSVNSSWLKDENGNIIYVTLADKIFNLIINKFVLLDPLQIGLEMDTDKPGWNDALNGLPGIFGSSISETIELLRLVKLYKSLIKDNKKSINVFSSLLDLVNNIMPLLEEKNNFTLWDKMNDYKEQYYSSYKTSLKEVSLSNSKLITILNKIIKVLEKSISNAKEIGHGVINTYLYFTVDSYVINENQIKVTSFKMTPLPLFLEGIARGGKLGKKYLSPSLVKKTDLYDKKLKIFKTSESLENVSFEIGRIRSFNPGWLERESDFLHMTYKYLLGVLKAGYYKEFFNLVKTNVPCFMKPETYGRSVFENVSFIVPTNHPNKDNHGKGFYARLTGANTEVIDALNIILYGEHLFVYKDGHLSFNVNPHIPLSLFKEGKIKTQLFKNIDVTFVNLNNKDFMEQNNISYVVDGVNYDVIVDNIALKIRNQEIKQLEIIIH